METACYAFLGLGVAAVPFILLIVAFVRTSTLRREVNELRAEINAFRNAWSNAYTAPAAAAPTPPDVIPSVARDLGGPGGTTPEPVAPEPLIETAPPPMPEPVAPPTLEVPIPQPATYPELVAAFTAAPEPPRSLADARDDSAGEPPPPPPPQAPPVRPAAPPRKPFDWESLVGVKLFSWIAGVSLVLAAVFFLKYSVEHGWLSAPVRAGIGLLTGVTLLVVCELRIARGYTFTANAMHGAGIAILYATFFAMHALWHLAPAGVVFFFMLIVTAVAVALSIRRASVFIALLGLMGGFATPALLSTGENRPIGLFSYLLMLNAGLAWVAFKKRWPALTIGSLLFTVIYQWAWIGKFLTASQLPLAATIFVIFAIVGSSTLWLRRNAEGEQGKLFERVSVGAAILPLFFGLFAAAVPAYGARYNTLFGFLLLMAAGLALVALFRKQPRLHDAGAVATIITFAVWAAISYRTAHAWPAVLGWLAAFVLLYLIAGTRTRSNATVTAGVLFFLFPVLAALEPATAAPGVLFGTMFVLLAIVAAYAVRYENGITYLVASGFAILTEGIWSANQLTAERLIPALVIYGAFGLLFLGAPALARRLGREITPVNGVAATVILSLGVLLFLTTHTIASAALWGLAFLLAILLCGTILEARATSKPILAGIAVVLSWIVLASWWEAAPLQSSLIPALFVIAFFGAVALLGSALVHRNNSYLALAGHLFLIFVAGQPALAIPPAPLFAVLAILTLAIGIAALYLRSPNLLLAGVVAGDVVLLAWAGTANTGNWPKVSLVAALAMAAFAIIWYVLARRRFDATLATNFAQPAVIALLMGHAIAIVAGLAPHATLFEPLLATHLVLVLAMLVLAWVTEAHVLSIASAVAAAVATLLFGVPAPGQQFIFAATLYVPFIAYPLLLGARVKRSLAPYVAAVIASGSMFVFGWNAMSQAHLDWIIGVLPVGLAIVTMLLLVRLLKIEPRGERMLSRLALVAGTALAFITVAIPLQLDKEWITIGWALEGAALAWLFTRIPHRGLVIWAGALLAAVFVRLVANPDVLEYHAVSATKILNWYLYTYLVAAASFFAAAYWLPKEWKKLVRATAAGGGILLFFLLNIEIADFYSTGKTVTFNFLSSSLAQDLTYTIGWAAFAIGVLIAGLMLRVRSSRVVAILLLLVTVLKCFLHDLARLGGLYRIASLFGLALSLFLVGVLLQKFVVSKADVPPAPEEVVP